MSSVTARTFRRIRTEVCAEVLVARGFHEDRSYGDAQFVRIQGSQLQAVHCQRSTKAPDFAINLAFDYVGRPLIGGSSGGLVDPNMCMTEYAFKTRLGEVQVGWDKWWPLGETTSDSRELLHDLLEKSVAFLDSTHEKWPEPERFLGLVEPADIVDVVKESPHFVAPNGILRMYLKLDGWLPVQSAMSFFMCFAACRAGDVSLAREFANIGTSLRGVSSERKASYERLIEGCSKRDGD